SSDRPGFAFEALERLGVRSEVLGQDFHSDVTAEARVAGAVNLAHAAFAERGPDLVGTKLGTGCQCHCRYSPFFGCRTVESIHREHLGAPLDSDSHPLAPGRQVTWSNATRGAVSSPSSNALQVAAKRDTCHPSSRLRPKSHLPGKWTQIRLLH